MPRLLIFAPCESVIVSLEGSISLITVFEGLNVSFPEEEYTNLPDDSFLPMTWNVLSKWIRDDNEEPHLWEQRIQVTMPDGRVPTDITTAFDLVANSGMHNIVRIDGFAIKPAGQVNLTLSLRKAGEEAPWQEITSYPMNLQNVPPEAEP